MSPMRHALFGRTAIGFRAQSYSSIETVVGIAQSVHWEVAKTGVNRA